MLHFILESECSDPVIPFLTKATSLHWWAALVLKWGLEMTTMENATLAPIKAFIHFLNFALQYLLLPTDEKQLPTVIHIFSSSWKLCCILSFSENSWLAQVPVSELCQG